MCYKGMTIQLQKICCFSANESVPSEGDTYYAAVAVEGCEQDSEILQLSTTVTTFVDEPDENLPP